MIGLSAHQLSTTHPPSEMTLGGMLKHLTRFEDDRSSRDAEDDDRNVVARPPILEVHDPLHEFLPP